MCRKGVGKEEEWKGRSGKVKGKRKKGGRKKRLSGREGGDRGWGGGKEAARKSIIFISILSLFHKLLLILPRKQEYSEPSLPLCYASS